MEQLGLDLNNELMGYLKSEFDNNKLNRLPENFGGSKIFSYPLIGVAQGNDQIFQKFKEIIGPDHLTPLEIWLSNDKEDMSASKLQVLSIVFPFEKKIQDESDNSIRLRGITLPAKIYSIARNYGNDFKKEIIKQTIKFLEKKGYTATSGIFSNSYTVIMKGGFYSTWSERYVAFAAGLGSFGLHEGLITEAGSNIRLGSIITNAPLAVSKRKSDEPYGNCLYYAKGICKECIQKYKEQNEKEV